jgi:hypothetical protein
MGSLTAGGSVDGLECSKHAKTGINNLPDSRGSIPSRGSKRIFPLHNHVQTGTGAHPAFCPMGTMGFHRVVKPLGREADH